MIRSRSRLLATAVVLLALEGASPAWTSAHAEAEPARNLMLGPPGSAQSGDAEHAGVERFLTAVTKDVDAY
jgi:hypothetical protein